MPSVEVNDALLDEKELSAQNAVASSKNNARTSELVCGYEILKVVKVGGLQMIVVGMGLNKGSSESFARPRPCLRDGD